MGEKEYGLWSTHVVIIFCHSCASLPCRQAGIHRGFSEMKNCYVYIMASKKNGTLYIGVTNDLIRRVYEHKNNFVKGFTSTYNVHRLVYYEQTTEIQSTISREKQLKKWNRDWEIELIEQMNPE
jgi:putative endonuclease